VAEPLEIINQFVMYFNCQIKQKELKVSVNPEVQGDPSALAKFKKYGLLMDVGLYQQILYNVFINACKFNRHSGSINIRFAVRSPAAIAQYRRCGPNRLVIETEIEDEGEGMDPEKQRALFKIFENIKENSIKEFASQRLKSKRCTSGNGLGLFLSQRLARFLDGEIKIESKKKKGTKASIILLVKLPTSEILSSLKDDKSEKSILKNEPASKKASLKSLLSQFKEKTK